MSSAAASRSLRPVLAITYHSSDDGTIAKSTDSSQLVKSLDQKIKNLPKLLVKPFAVLRSPFTRKGRIATRNLAEEEQKLRQTHHLRRAALRRAKAEERLSRRTAHEMRVLSLAESGAGSSPGSSPPSLALAAARAVEEVAQAEQDLVNKRIEESIAQLNVLRQQQDDMQRCVAEAKEQVTRLQSVLHEHGIQECDLDKPTIPPTPPNTPPPSKYKALDLVPYSDTDSVAESG
ncbi:hypothetical protein CVT26_010027 [Gymnopilus dilepis]|uniref:Uncharacterized protein n=1 Tax=Gymnopilus dilepis TaxID=231916 RepID=A0A409Y6N6_9AGAR|nr:hypothetical protein CVT26_010027 [Gymnopilus dilepis]